MLKNWFILVAVILVVTLPILFRAPREQSDWRRGDPELVIVTPMNEAVRDEFGRAFSAWHRKQYGRPVKLDWRVVGGTTEISRYLQAQYTAAARAWWRQAKRRWPSGMGDRLFDLRLDIPPARVSTADRDVAEVRRQFLQTDNPQAFTCGIDLFFGGGEFDQSEAARKGFTVPLDTVYKQIGDLALYPEQVRGETWRTRYFAGTALSVFGICYNLDRLRDLGVPPPAQWDDLTNPAYFRQLALTDPTKSGSAAKAFEMMIQQQCRRALEVAGFDHEAINVCESIIGSSPPRRGAVPQGVPLAYPQALEAGWRRGLALIQLLGANARYFSEASGRVPLDVSDGNAAVGVCIDFYARFQAAHDIAVAGRPRMTFVAPVGGTSVSCDPISLLRGAEHRTIAERFIVFALSAEGQRLWVYRSGIAGGPAKYALWRLPIRRDFYPTDDPGVASCYQQQRDCTVFNLAEPGVNAYALATNFTYVARWTSQHFGVHRDLIKAMCLDSGSELRAAWRAILEHGGPAVQPEAMRLLTQLPERPEPLTWASALDVTRRYNNLDYTRQWTDCFRRNYRAAEKLASKKR